MASLASMRFTYILLDPISEAERDVGVKCIAIDKG